MMLQPNNARTMHDNGAQCVRQPPHNLEAEQALLGAILVNNEALDRVSSFLSPDHFFDPLHGRIYETLATLIHAGKTATPITVKTFFENVEPIDATMTVPQYLGRLAANATTIINAAEYGRTIYDLATRRSLILIGEDMVNTAYDAAVNCAPTLLIEEAEQRLFDIAEHGTERSDAISFREIASRVVQQANEAHRLKGVAGGLPTGLLDLDNLLGGLRRSDLIILGGRPSMGKTALATNIAYNVAKNGWTDADGVWRKTPVGFFSLEMNHDQIGTRVISTEADLNAFEVSRGHTSEQDIRKLIATAQSLDDLPLYIDHHGGITIAQLSARARRLKRRREIGLLVVDYVQLLAGQSNKAENRVVEITQISAGLKSLAKELDIPVLALSQLSRQVEQREDKRPQLSDLRDSGSIEQDADVVMFVYREEYYLRRAMPDPESLKFSEAQTRLAAIANKAEVIIGKQRHGPVGTVMLQFNSSRTQFSSPSSAYR